MRARLEITPIEFVVGFIFGGLVIAMFALGAGATQITVMFFVAVAEIYALAELRRPTLDASRAGGWLQVAALMTIGAAALCLVPGLLDDHVKSCYDCSNEADDVYYDHSYNYFGLFIFMWMAGISAGVVALIGWTISLTRLYGRSGLSRS